MKYIIFMVYANDSDTITGCTIISDSGVYTSDSVNLIPRRFILVEATGTTITFTRSASSTAYYDVIEGE